MLSECKKQFLVLVVLWDISVRQYSSSVLLKGV
jgi:hypothetical protein